MLLKMNFTRFLNVSSTLRRKILTNPQNYCKTCSSIEKSSIKRNEIIGSQIRNVSTYEVKSASKEESLVNKVLRKIPFLNIDKLRVKAAGYFLYEGIADHINYIDMFEEWDLPDTFYSWFVITELYIWMLSARAMAEGDDGRHVRNGLLEAFWLDVAQRVKRLGIGSSTLVKQQIRELSEQLQAALIAYDEGLQSDDIVLAGALWRRLYQSGPVNPEKLLHIVKYIRKQMVLLDNMSRDQIVKERSVRWENIKK